MDDIRNDGYANFLSSFGTDRDPAQAVRATPDARLHQRGLEAIYRSDGIGRRIVDLPADEMTRQWITIEGDKAEERLAELEELGAKQAINKALRWAGLYGGAIMVQIVDDGSADLEEPLNEARVRGISDLLVYDRWQTSWTIQDISTDPGSRWYGRAEYIMVHPISGTPFRCHRTRFMVFDGQDVPDHLRQRNDGWGDSRLQAPYRAMTRYAEAMGATSGIIRDFIQPTLSMSNLTNMIAAGEEDVVKKRLEMLGLSRSILNVLLIDSDNETYTKQASSVQGIDKLLQELKHNLSAVTGIPQTKLFGRSPEGQNATGEGDIRNFYDLVKSEQEGNMLPPVRHLVRLLDISDGGEPEDRKVTPAPLWQPDAAEKAATLEQTARAVALLLDQGVIAEDEAREIVDAVR